MKTKEKKIILFAILLVGAVFVLAGCGDNKTKNGASNNSGKSITEGNNVREVGKKCRELWWYDNESSGCSKKEFCGLYMYQGLRTFESEKECEKSFQNQNSETEGSSAEGDWQTYTNEKYNYSLEYPESWFFVDDACCPPPPGRIVLNNTSSKKEEYSVNYSDKGVYGISFFCNYEGEIDEIGEIEGREGEGERMEINGFDAIQFSKNATPGDDSEQVVTTYIVNGEQGCRSIYTTKCPECSKILNSFQYN